MFILFLLLVCSFISDALSFLFSINSIPTSPVFNIYFFVQFLLLSAIYHRCFDGKSWVIVLVFCFLAIYVVTTAYLPNWRTLNTYAMASGSIILVIFALTYLYLNIRESQDFQIFHLPVFWISFAVLFYHSGTLLLTVLNNYLLTNFKDAYGLIWILHNVCNIVKNLLFGLGIWQIYRNMKSYS